MRRTWRGSTWIETKRWCGIGRRTDRHYANWQRRGWRSPGATGWRPKTTWAWRCSTAARRPPAAALGAAAATAWAGRPPNGVIPDLCRDNLLLEASQQPLRFGQVVNPGRR